MRQQVNPSRIQRPANLLRHCSMAVALALAAFATSTAVAPVWSSLPRWEQRLAALDSVLAALKWLPMAVYGAAWMATERSRQVMALLRQAIHAHTSEKAAAIDMGISPSLLSEWFAGSKPANLARIASLPDAVLYDFARLMLERSGAYTVAPNRVIAEQTEAIRQLTVEMRLRRMAKARGVA